MVEEDTISLVVDSPFPTGVETPLVVGVDSMVVVSNLGGQPSTRIPLTLTP